MFRILLFLNFGFVSDFDIRISDLKSARVVLTIYFKYASVGTS
jgi:hypothetical protein